MSVVQKKLARQAHASAKTEEMARLADARELAAYRIAFENVPMSIGMFDADGKKILLNERSRALYQPDGRPGPLDEDEVSMPELLKSGFFDKLMDNPQQHFQNVFAALSRGEDYCTQMKLGESCRGP